MFLRSPGEPPGSPRDTILTHPGDPLGSVYLVALVSGATQLVSLSICKGYMDINLRSAKP